MTPARRPTFRHAARGPAALPMAATAAATALLLLLPACASMSGFPAVVVPQSLDVPADEGRSLVLLASGVQLYECHADKQSPDAPHWLLRGPEATLSDDGNHVVGRHGPGLAWEASDGTRLAGVVRHKVDAPRADALPWLLVETQAAGPRKGLFAGVRHVQRVATRGGMPPPAERCTAAHVGEVERVPFEAQYWFWSARWTW